MVHNEFDFEVNSSKKEYVSPEICVKKFSVNTTITLSEGDPKDVDDGKNWGPLTPA
ncbi:MAG: hypothetical protein K6F77_08175 [Lachnospiraceae bacterium]|nr:hypothetical protein [Lachnospiraceae bacterium]